MPNSRMPARDASLNPAPRGFRGRVTKMKYQLVKFGSRFSRRVVKDGKVIVMIEALTDGLWGAFDLNGNRITTVPRATTDLDAFRNWQDWMEKNDKPSE